MINDIDSPSPLKDAAHERLAPFLSTRASVTVEQRGPLFERESVPPLRRAQAWMDRLGWAVSDIAKSVVRRTPRGSDVAPDIVEISGRAATGPLGEETGHVERQHLIERIRAGATESGIDRYMRRNMATYLPVVSFEFPANLAKWKPNEITKNWMIHINPRTAVPEFVGHEGETRYMRQRDLHLDFVIMHEAAHIEGTPRYRDAPSKTLDAMQEDLRETYASRFKSRTGDMSWDESLRGYVSSNEFFFNSTLLRHTLNEVYADVRSVLSLAQRELRLSKKDGAFDERMTDLKTALDNVIEFRRLEEKWFEQEMVMNDHNTRPALERLRTDMHAAIERGAEGVQAWLDGCGRDHGLNKLTHRYTEESLSRILDSLHTSLGQLAERRADEAIAAQADCVAQKQGAHDFTQTALRGEVSAMQHANTTSASARTDAMQMSQRFTGMLLGTDPGIKPAPAPTILRPKHP